MDFRGVITERAQTGPRFSAPSVGWWMLVSVPRVHYEYAVLFANRPGVDGTRAAILLRTIDDDHLAVRVRPDLSNVLDADSAELLTATVHLLVEQAASIGAGALFDELEDTLSNFITISPRSSGSSLEELSLVLDALETAHFPRRA